MASASYFTIATKQYDCDVASTSDFTITTQQYDCDVASTRDLKKAIYSAGTFARKL